jgi:hypothetical protein
MMLMVRVRCVLFWGVGGCCFGLRRDDDLIDFSKPTIASDDSHRRRGAVVEAAAVPPVRCDGCCAADTALLQIGIVDRGVHSVGLVGCVGGCVCDSKVIGAQALGSIDLRQCHDVCPCTGVDARKHSFQIVTPMRTWLIVADSAVEMTQWIGACSRDRRRHRAHMHSLSSSLSCQSS